MKKKKYKEMLVYLYQNMKRNIGWKKGRKKLKEKYRKKFILYIILMTKYIKTY